MATDAAIVVEPEVEDLPAIHKAGKFMFTGAVTFLANEAADRAYDAALRYVRNRRKA
jgi:hypothetical protein